MMMISIDKEEAVLDDGLKKGSHSPSKRILFV